MTIDCCMWNSAFVIVEARVEGAMTHHKQVQQERHDQMLLSPRLRTVQDIV